MPSSREQSSGVPSGFADRQRATLFTLAVIMAMSGKAMSYENRLKKGRGNITIPNTVTTIGEYAFECCNSLTSITIPAGITSIGRSTFEDCTGLISVTIPDSVTVIGQEAFYRCEKLTSITIPSSVTEIGYEAFWGCSNLTDIYVNQTESTLLDNADVPDDCRIHWNESV